MTSTRSPGKSLKNIGGVPLVQGFHDNIKRKLPGIDVVFLIPEDPRDDGLADFLVTKGINMFRGSTHDVMGRFASAIKALNLTSDSDLICRLTGDCLFFDANAFKVMNEVITREGLNYVSNRLVPTFPDGLDIEIFRAVDLLNIESTSKSDFEREHVTPFFYKKDSPFIIGNVRNRIDLSNFRLTFDYDHDFFAVEQFLCKNKMSYFDLDPSDLPNLDYLHLISSDDNETLRNRVFDESGYQRRTSNFNDYNYQGKPI